MLGGQFNHVNYFFVTSFPNHFLVTADNIYAVLVVYEITHPIDQSNDGFFGTNLQFFAQDTAICSYLTATMDTKTDIPSGIGQKPDVYNRDSIPVHPTLAKYLFSL